jgi:thymidylate synthase ThyX
MDTPRLCQLRLDPQAQKEIRDYAEAVSQLLEEAFPVSSEALIQVRVRETSIDSFFLRIPTSMYFSWCFIFIYII